MLQKVDVSGGAPPGAGRGYQRQGGTWAHLQPSPLWSVQADGTGAAPLTWDLFSKGEESHRCLSSFPMVTIFCFGPGILNTPRMIL
jgi:hypothetical protein